MWWMDECADSWRLRIQRRISCYRFAYRDARINRIFEGMNEINRLLTVDMLLKKALKGKLDLMTPAMQVQKDLMAIPDFGKKKPVLFQRRKKRSAMQKAILMVAGAAVQKLMMTLEKRTGDINECGWYAHRYILAESLLLRVKKMYEKERGSVHLYRYAQNIYVGCHGQDQQKRKNCH